MPATTLALPAAVLRARLETSVSPTVPLMPPDRVIFPAVVLTLMPEVLAVVPDVAKPPFTLMSPVSVEIVVVLAALTLPEMVMLPSVEAAS